MSNFDIRIKEVGAEATAKSLDKLEKSIEDVSKSSSEIDKKSFDFTKANEQSIKLSDNFEKLSNAAGSLGGPFGELAGRIGVVKTGIEGVSGLISGPVAIAFGGFIAVIMALTEAVKLKNEILEESRNRLNNQISALQDAAAKINETKQQWDDYNSAVQGAVSVNEAVANSLAATNDRMQAQARLGTTLKNAWEDTFAQYRRYASVILDSRDPIEAAMRSQNELVNIQNENRQALINSIQREIDLRLGLVRAEARAAEDARKAAAAAEAGKFRRQGGGAPRPFEADATFSLAEADALEAREMGISQLQNWNDLVREISEFESAADVQRRIAIEEQNMLLEEQLALTGKIAEQKRLDAENERIALEQATNDKIIFEEKRIASQQAQEEKFAKQRQKQEAIVGNAIGNIQQLTMQSIELAKQEGITRKEAFLSALDAWLKGFAIEQAFKGAENTINAIASYARYDYAAGSQFLAAAAGNFALAAAAGGASAAIPNVGAGGAGAPQAQETPEDQSQRNQNMVININGQTYMTERQVSDAIRNALEAGGRRT